LRRPAWDTGTVTVQYLSLQEFAERIGVSRGALAGYKLPEPDVRVGSAANSPRGWSEETIDAWNKSRPGRGRWGSRE
jgi:predicted DNA-binding transcriptional regulator AlpA